MASLINDPLGGKVGFRVRHESKASSSTRVLVVTTGVLVRRLQSDPSLEGVAAVVFDECAPPCIEAVLAAYISSTQLTARSPTQSPVAQFTSGRSMPTSPSRSAASLRQSCGQS